MVAKKQYKKSTKFRNQLIHNLQEGNYSNDDVKWLIEELNTHIIELEAQNNELFETQIKLQEAGQKYQDLFQNTPVSSFLADDAMVILNANQEASNIFSLKKKQIIGKKFSTFIHEDDVKAFNKFISALKKTSRQKVITLKIVDGNNTSLFARITGQKLTENNKTFFRLAILDISELKNAEELIRNQYNTIKSLINSSADGIAIVSKSGQILECNDTFASQLRYKEQKEIIGKSIFEIIPNKYKKSFIQAIRDVTDGIKITEIIFKIEADEENEGSSYYELLMHQASDDLYNKKSVVMNIRDVTDRLKMENHIIQSEEKYRLITENINSIIVELNEQGEIQFVNQAIKNVLGYEIDELIGKQAFDLVHPKEREMSAAVFKDILQKNKKSGPNHWQILHKDGSWRICNARYSMIERGAAKRRSIIMISDDITDVLNMQEKIRQDEYLYRTLTANIPNIALFLFNRDLVHLIASGLELKEFPQISSVIEGKTVLEVFPGQFGSQLQELYNSAFKDIKLSTEYEIDDKHYHIQIIPVKEGNKRIEAGVSIFQNITEEKKNEEKLTQAKKRAEKENAAKTEFLMNISHEIRTPLNSIIGFAEQLRKKNREKSKSTHIDIILNAAHHLKEVVNETLTISQIASHQISLKKSRFNVAHLVQDVCNMSVFAAEKKNLYFTYSINESLDDIFIGNPMHLRQVLINLINNAIKFTQQGFVKLIVNHSSENSDSLPVRFDVIDSGPGISVEKQKEIFNRFKQVDQDITKVYQGSGLGLAISRKLIALQNGKMQLSSSPGMGSAFTITVPLKKAKNDIEKEKHLPEAININEAIKKKKILVVDDDENNLLLMEVILKNWGMTPDMATNGKEAIEKIKKKPYDLIFMDIKMPVMDGLQTIQFIRNKMEKPAKNTPIVAVSANVLEKDKKLYKTFKVDGYIIKPYTEEQILKQFINLFRENPKKPIQDLKSKQLKKQTTKKPYDLSDLIDITKADPVLTNKLIMTFIKNAQNNLYLIENNFKKENFPELREIAHKMKASFKHLKIKNVVSMLDIIEEQGTQGHQRILEPVLFKLSVEINKICSSLKEEIKNFRKINKNNEQ